MTQLLLAIQAGVATLAAGVVGLELLAAEWAALIVVICSVVNAALGAYLGTASQAVKDIVTAMKGDPDADGQ